MLSLIAARKIVGTEKKPKNKLTKERIRALDALGFDWNRKRPVLTEESRNNMLAAQKVTSENKFAGNLSRLKAFKEAHGHCNVDYHLAEMSLYSWVWSVIASYNTVGTEKKPTIKLTKERIRALEELGFNWTLKRPFYREESRNAISAGNTAESDKAFAIRMSQLKAYKKEYGHCYVSWKHDTSLNAWVWCIIASREGGKSNTILNDERIRALDELGFDWKREKRKQY
jgi:hypothetical protein